MQVGNNFVIRGEIIMPLVKIGEKHQITIPIDIFKKLHLKAGDVMDANLKGNNIVMVPSLVIPKGDVWFHTKELQKKEVVKDKNSKC